MTPEIDELSKQIEENPTNAWLYHDRAQCFLMEKKKAQQVRDFVRLRACLHQADEDFGRAIELDPEDPELWLARGKYNGNDGHVTLALRDLGRAIELAPDDARAHRARGWFQADWHRIEDALVDYDRAIALDPTNASYHSELGEWISRRCDDLERSLASFAEAIRLAPENPSYRDRRANALLYENPNVRPEEALPDIEAAIRLGPEVPYYRLHRGYIRYLQGRWGEAADDFMVQDVPYMYQLCKYEGAELAAWVYLAKLFQGDEATGLAYVQCYLKWYVEVSTAEAEADPRRNRAMEYWPVPLARYLAGEIDEAELRVAADDVLIIPGDQEEQIGEYHFVMGELCRHRGEHAEALAHMEQTRGLPMRSPMRWVVDHRARARASDGGVSG